MKLYKLFFIIFCLLVCKFSHSQLFVCDQFQNLNDYADSVYYENAYCIPLVELGDVDSAQNLFSATTGSSFYNPYTGKTYFGNAGGLYLGSNTRTGAYKTKGISTGVYDITPEYVEGYDTNLIMLCVGGSTPIRIASVFDTLREDVNPDLTILNGCLAGSTLEGFNAGNLVDFDDDGIVDGTYFSYLKYKLDSIHAHPLQVKVLWLMTTSFYSDTDSTQHDVAYSETQHSFKTSDYTEEKFNGYIEYMTNTYKQFLDSCKVYFPNVKIMYLSDRQYQAYRNIHSWSFTVFPPYDYWIGWGIKKIIEDYITGLYWNEETDPYITWGPYFWRRGDLDDDLFPEMHTYDEHEWICDFYDGEPGDGLHLDINGSAYAAEWMHQYFLHDETACWYRTTECDTSALQISGSLTNQKNTFQLYPSLITYTATIIQNPNANTYKRNILMIYNVYGQLVEQILLDTFPFHYICKLEYGIYTYMIQSDGLIESTGKFIKL